MPPPSGEAAAGDGAAAADGDGDRALPPALSAAPLSPAPSLLRGHQVMWCTRVTPSRFTDQAATGRPRRSTMGTATLSVIPGSRCRSAPAMLRRPPMDLRREPMANLRREALF